MPGIRRRIREGLMLRMLRHSRFFDAAWYRRKNGLAPDEDAAAHYFCGGWKNSDPSPAFRQEAYLAVHEDVRQAEVCPLAHYLFYRRGEACPGIVDIRWRARPLSAGLRRVRADARGLRGKKLLALVQLTDLRACRVMAEELKSLRPCACKVVVTLPEGEDASSLRRQFSAPGWQTAFRTAPEGQAWATSFLQALREQASALEACEAAVALSSTPEAAREGLEAALGPENLPEIFRRLHREPETALGAPGLTGGDPPFRQTLVRRELHGAGLSLRPGYAFVRGGCFWLSAGRAGRLLSELKEGFDPPPRALERYLTACQETEVSSPARPACPGVVAFAVSETGAGAVKGDAFTARELAEAMENRGWKTVFLPREGGEKDWRDVGPQPDVLVSMLEDYVPGEIRGAKAGLLTVAWARNWFAKWMENPAMEDYGLVLATGETIARRMASRLGREVRVLPIAANTARFSPGTPTPEEREKYGCDYCFTGNRFSAARGLEEVLAPEEGPWRFRLFGDGWQEHPRLGAYACGHVAYEEMPALYRCARIVLDDATPSTLEAGSVNSRVFDALAAGCLVLTNNGPGARETFEGKLPVFTDRASLQALLRRYLEDEEARRVKVRELSALVRKRHTYALRAQALEGWIAAWQAEMRSMEETENR